MGFGSYVALGYGAVLPERYQECSDDEDSLLSFVDRFDREHKTHICTPYDAEPSALYIRLAVSDRGLAASNEPDMSVIETAKVINAAVDLDCIERQSEFVLEVDEQKLPKTLMSELHGGKKIDAARATWSAFRAAAKEQGFDIPEGKFLVIADWD